MHDGFRRWHYFIRHTTWKTIGKKMDIKNFLGRQPGINYGNGRRVCIRLVHCHCTNAPILPWNADAMLTATIDISKRPFISVTNKLRPCREVGGSIEILILTKASGVSAIVRDQAFRHSPRGLNEVFFWRYTSQLKTKKFTFPHKLHFVFPHCLL